MTDWDQLWSLNGYRFNAWPNEDLVRWASTLDRGSRVLEVGCGSGANLRALESFGMKVWGVDVAEPAVLAAGSFSASLQVKLGSAIELEFPSESFDAVCDVQCFQHLAQEDLPRAYSEAARVLKHHGQFFEVFLIGGQRRYPDLAFCDFDLAAILAGGLKAIRRGYMVRDWVGEEKLVYALIEAVKP